MKIVEKTNLQKFYDFSAPQEQLNRILYFLSFAADKNTICCDDLFS